MGGGILLNESAYGSPTTVIPFSHRIAYSGNSLCAAAANKTVSVPGLLATDIVIINLTVNSNARWVITIAPAADQFVVTFNDVTQVTDHIFYMVLRAV